MATKFVKWENAFSIGLEIIDNQHKELIDIINRIYEAQNSERKEFLKKFLEYANFHFITEEKIIDKVKFPQTEKHKLSHKKFKEYIFSHFQNIENISIDDLFDFAVDWLVNHVLREDQELGLFIQKNNIKINLEDL